MGCSNCASDQGKAPKGCKNNGICGSDSCNNFTVFDWLSNMVLPAGQSFFDIVEVRFKNGRKGFYRNTGAIALSIGDIVATEASPGHDVGMITLTGELVKVQMKKKNINRDETSFLKIYRKASQKDIDIWTASRNKEPEVQKRARELAMALELEMKISDVEFQGDGSKATFYYTAEDRVDFRQLIKNMVEVFKIRVEMRQVGYRQEASRLGGIGSCGRELCCSTWLTDFRTVSTAAARYQQLSINPQKLAGQCGKLKCCLNYELDSYLEILQGFPGQKKTLRTEKGLAVCQKIDIFKQLMWYAYKENSAQWYQLHIKHVHQILARNKTGENVASLEEYAIENEEPVEKDRKNVMQDSLTRFDKPRKKRRKNQRKNNNRRNVK